MNRPALAHPRPLPAWAAALPPFIPEPNPFLDLLEDQDPSAEPGADDLMGAPRAPQREVMRLAAIERALGHRFGDRRLLRCALTSKGWVNEHPGSWPDNKALEWLGDAVIYLATTQEMVLKGEAAHTGNSTPRRDGLVSNGHLAEIGEALGLWEALYLGKGEHSNNAPTGRARFLACTVEAVIGAVYLDVYAAGGAPQAACATLWARLRELQGLSA